MSTGKKKWPRVLLIIALCLIAAFFVMRIVNKTVSKNQMSLISNAYGESCETEAGKINYTVIGDGEKTVVILPGHGSPSPHYEFLDMATKLSSDYREIIIEPLGYGLSDDTDKERTSENICNEIHEVLAHIGVDRYFIAGHSIAGVYLIKYANMFENEVEGVIGFDASVPSQVSYESHSVDSFALGLYRFFLIDSGCIRLSVSGITSLGQQELQMLKGTPFQPFATLSSEDKKVYAELIASRTQNVTVRSEIGMFADNCRSELDLNYPESIPVLYILSQDSVDSDKKWVSSHEALTCNNAAGKVEVIKGNHYIHLSNDEETLKLTKEWLSSVIGAEP